jgi:hypothetical protein
MMKVSFLPTIKQGDTFYYYIQWDGALLSELKSQVKNSFGFMISEVTIEETGTAGLFKLSVTNTSEWPQGTLYTDVRRNFTGGTESSETVGIVVERGITE